MFKSTIKKTVTAAAVVITAVILTLPAHSQESQVNSTDVSAIVYGGLGYGDTNYGTTVTEEKDIDDITNMGEGKGYALEMGAFINYSFIGAELYLSSVQLNDLKSDVAKYYGDGYYMTINAVGGFKLFTEPEDMGYTFLYGGLRYWQVERDVDRVGTMPDSGYKEELSGKGWIVGFRDYSTYPVNSFSIVLQSGLSFYNAPLENLKYDGQKYSFSVVENEGASLELGLGVAFESIGLSVVASYKYDWNTTLYKVEGATDYETLNTAYNQYILTITKDFSI